MKLIWSIIDTIRDFLGIGIFFIAFLVGSSSFKELLRLAVKNGINIQELRKKNES